MAVEVAMEEATAVVAAEAAARAGVAALGWLEMRRLAALVADAATSAQQQSSSTVMVRTEAVARALAVGRAVWRSLAADHPWCYSSNQTSEIHELAACARRVRRRLRAVP